MANYFDSLYDILEDSINAENKDIRREYGVGYLYCSDHLWDKWVCEVVEKIEIGEDEDFEDYCKNATKEQYHFLMADMEDFLDRQFHWKNRDKLIDERIAENRQEAKTRAMEMGYNNYSDGVYWREW